MILNIQIENRTEMENEKLDLFFNFIFWKKMGENNSFRKTITLLWTRWQSKQTEKENIEISRYRGCECQPSLWMKMIWSMIKTQVHYFQPASGSSAKMNHFHPKAKALLNLFTFLIFWIKILCFSVKWLYPGVV